MGGPQALAEGFREQPLPVSAPGPLHLPFLRLAAGAGRGGGTGGTGGPPGRKVIKITEELFSSRGEGGEEGKAALEVALQTLGATSPP